MAKTGRPKGFSFEDEEFGEYTKEATRAIQKRKKEEKSYYFREGLTKALYYLQKHAGTTHSWEVESPEMTSDMFIFHIAYNKLEKWDKRFNLSSIEMKSIHPDYTGSGTHYVTSESEFYNHILNGTLKFKERPMQLGMLKLFENITKKHKEFLGKKYLENMSKLATLIKAAEKPQNKEIQDKDTPNKEIFTGIKHRYKDIHTEKKEHTKDEIDR